MGAGVNDATIFMGILFFLMLFGVVSPYINTDFGQSLPDGQTIDPNTSPSIADIGLSTITTIFFWNFGANIPFWLNVLLWIPRAMMYVFIGKWLFGAGG